MKIYLGNNDKCFKCIFQNPLNQDLLGILVQSVTGCRYSNISYSNIEKNINMYIRKKYLDMNLDFKEALVNIEVNRFNRNYIYPRNTSFICDCYSNNVLVNGKYTEDKNIIQINFSYGVKSDVPIKKYMILNTDRSDSRPRVKNLIIYEVCMDYILRYWYNRNKHEVNFKNVIKYRYFIMLSLNLEELEELYQITKDERIVKYMEELKKVNTEPQFRQFITDEQDIQFIMNTEKEEGEKRGEKRGILKSKFETAKKMLKEQFDIETISKLTDLSLDQIKSISL